MGSEAEILRLADVISQSTKLLSQRLTQHGLRMPSFDTDSPAATLPNQSAEIVGAKTTAVNACVELLDLLQGPLTLSLIHI